MRKKGFLMVAIVCVALMAAIGLVPAMDVTTYRYNLTRDGNNSHEKTLTPGNVKTGTFGRLSTWPVDGQVFAQPLVARGLVYVATEHNSVYAFAVDGGVVWQDRLGPSVPSAALCNALIVPEIGITSTPVIDLASNAIYVVTYTLESGSFFYRLHALDLKTGAEKFGGPVALAGSVPGTGDGGTTVTFAAVWHLQRSALLLLGGNVYIAFASHSDCGPYHGWVFSYNAKTLRNSGIWNATPNGTQGGIWMSGDAPAVIGHDLYLMTGNGTFDADQGGADYGDSVVKLTLKRGALVVRDYFTPADQASINAQDLDLGSGGLAVLPHHQLIGGSKGGVLYRMDAGNLGGYHPSGDLALQEVQIGTPGFACGIYSTPAYFDSKVYAQPVCYTPLKMLALVGGALSTPPLLGRTEFGQTLGPSPVVSSNGKKNAIVWQEGPHVVPGSLAYEDTITLYAFDPDTLAVLYESDAQPGDVIPDNADTHFAIPTVANGRVYVGASASVSVFGLK